MKNTWKRVGVLAASLRQHGAAGRDDRSGPAGDGVDDEFASGSTREWLTTVPSAPPLASASTVRAFDGDGAGSLR